VHDGYVLTKSINRSPVGGRLLTTCLLKALEGRGVQVRACGVVAAVVWPPRLA
jgi:actin-like protein 6A